MYCRADNQYDFRSIYAVRFFLNKIRPHPTPPPPPKKKKKKKKKSEHLNVLVYFVCLCVCHLQWQIAHSLKVSYKHLT